jgi:hypothetical protein
MLKGLLLPRPSVAQVRCVQENLGDIMVYHAIERLLAGLTIVSYSKDCRKHRLIEETSFLRKIFRFAMLGGGTLIFSPRNVGWLGNLEHLVKHSIPLCTFGTGVVDPKFVAESNEAIGLASPLDEESIEGWVECLKMFPFVSVRGNASKRILAEHGLNEVEVVGDPAIFYAYAKIHPKPRKKRIGINVLTTQNFWSGSRDGARDEMLQLIKVLNKDNWEVVLFPTCDEDLDFTAYVREQSGLKKIEVFSRYLDVEAYLTGIKEMDVFVGMRLHSVVAACCVYTPAIMVSYQPKGLDFMETIGLEKFHLRSDQFSADDLMARIESLYENLDEVQQEQYEKCDLMKKRLQGFAQRTERHIISLKV